MVAEKKECILIDAGRPDEALGHRYPYDKICDCGFTEEKQCKRAKKTIGLRH